MGRAHHEPFRLSLIVFSGFAGFSAFPDLSGFWLFFSRLWIFQSSLFIVHKVEYMRSAFLAPYWAFLTSLFGLALYWLGFTISLFLLSPVAFLACLVLVRLCV